MRLISVLALIWFILFSQLNAKKSRYIGTPTGKLLSIETDPNVNALAGTYCGYVKDLVGYEANIAGIADLKDKHLKLGYYDWLLDTSIQYIAFGMPFVGIPYIKQGVAVAGLKFLSVPEFSNKNDWGEDSGILDASNFIFSLGFASKYKSYLKYGLNMKYGYQGYTLDENSLISVSSFCFDLGAQYRWKYIKLPITKKKKYYIYNFQTGIALQNFGFNTSDDSLPRRIKLGLSFPFVYTPVNQAIFLFDINRSLYTLGSLIESDYRFNLGLEYNYKKIIYVRTGLKFGYDESSFTIGVGLQKQLGSFLSMFSYSFGSHNELGNLNNGGASAKFEEISLRPPLPPEKQILVDYHYYHGLSYFVQDKLEQAIQEWEKVLKIDPGNPDAKSRIEETQKLLNRNNDIESIPGKNVVPELDSN